MGVSWLYAVDGIVLGVAAGFAPGPLLALVVAQTLRFGAREGLKVAFVPLLTDAPAIVLSLAAVSSVSSVAPVLGVITMIGALFVLYLAYDSLCAAVPDARTHTDSPKSVVRGVLVNVLSPHPYLFWLAVGAPSVVRAWHTHWLAAIGFVGTFYLGLVGVKALVAISTGRSKSLLTGRAYIVLMRVLAVLLAVFGCRLVWEGLQVLTLESL